MLNKEHKNFFNQRMHLILHKKLHTKDEPYKYNKFGSDFVREGVLLGMRMFIMEKSYECLLVGKLLGAGQTLMVIHMVRDHHVEEHGKSWLLPISCMK